MTGCSLMLVKELYLPSSKLIESHLSGEGLNPDSGVFTCPVGGTYMFMVHLATHKDKKALLSLRKNGMDIASIINQDGKNKGNHMMGQCVLMELDPGDEV